MANGIFIVAQHYHFEIGKSHNSGQIGSCPQVDWRTWHRLCMTVAEVRVPKSEMQGTSSGWHRIATADH